MNVFCPSCGHRFDTLPPPHDPDGVVSCPKCLSTFATSGLASPPVAEPRRKFKKKPAKSGSVVPVVAGLVAVLVAGGAAAYFAFLRPGASGTSGPSAASPDDWKEYVSDDGKFRVLVPATPSRTKLPNGSVEYKLDTGELVLGVVYADLVGPTLGKTNPEKVMTRERDDSIKAGGKLVRERDVMAGSHKGTEFVIDVPGKGPTHYRYIAVNRRVYKLEIGGKTAPPSDRDVARFFDSFQVTG